MNKIDLRKVQTMGEAISTTFSFIGQNFKPLFKVFAYYLAIPILLVGIVMGKGMTQYMKVITDFTENPPATSDPADSLNILGELFNPYFLIGIFFSSVLSIIMIAVIFRFMNLYVNSEDGQVDLQAIKSTLAPDAVKMLLAGLVVGLITMFGMLLFIIPGLYLSIGLMFVFSIMIEEKLGVGDAIKRSLDLVKENWWRSFGFILIMYFIFFTISSLVQLPFTFATILAPTMGAEKLDLILGISASVSTIVRYITSIFIYVAIGIWYYNLVEQKDGSNLLKSLDQIGQTDDKPNLDYFR